MPIPRKFRQPQLVPPAVVGPTPFQAECRAGPTIELRYQNGEHPAILTVPVMAGCAVPGAPMNDRQHDPAASYWPGARLIRCPGRSPISLLATADSLSCQTVTAGAAEARYRA